MSIERPTRGASGEKTIVGISFIEGGKMGAGHSSIDPSEVEKFARIADEWWDPFGKFKPLHKFNPARLSYIRDAAAAHFGRDRRAGAPLEGLSLLDVGCGGGLVAEPMCRLGADVVAIDASSQDIKTAMVHAEQQRLMIDYRTATVEDLIEAGEDQFDIVLNLEVIEHVADPELFLSYSASLVRPGGMMIVATINRTIKALAMAKIGAEYVLRWLPRGTHDPAKFLKPEEVERALSKTGLSPIARAGVVYNPLMDVWRIAEDTDVNYMVTAVNLASPD